jgi:hypothetical protein
MKVVKNNYDKIDNFQFEIKVDKVSVGKRNSGNVFPPKVDTLWISKKLSLQLLMKFVTSKSKKVTLLQTNGYVMAY